MGEKAKDQRLTWPQNYFQELYTCIIVAGLRSSTLKTQREGEKAYRSIRERKKQSGDKERYLILIIYF